MVPERRATILHFLRKYIPIAAKRRREVIKKNARYCKLCIIDAFNGRLSNGLANNSPEFNPNKSRWEYNLFCLNTSEYVYNAVLIACALNTMIIFFQPPNVCSDSFFHRALNAVIIGTYAFDIALKIGYEGLKEYMSKDWQIVYAAVTVAMIIETLLFGCLYFTNPFRPVQGVLRARAGRRFFDVLKKMLPTMVHKMMPIFFFISILMVLSCLAFDKSIDEFQSTYYASYNWFFLVFTNDTFDRILPEKVFGHLAYLLVFFPSIYLGQRFLLSLIIGDTYDTFRQFVKAQVKNERLKEIKGLTKAFAALDDEKRGMISFEVFKACMMELYPGGLADELIALYYELLSGGSNTGLSVLQFMNLRHVLSFKLSLVTDTSALGAVNDAIFSPFKFIYDNVYSIVTVPLPRYGQEHWVPFAENLIAFLSKGGWLQVVNSCDVFLQLFSLEDFKILALGNRIFITPCLLVNCFYLMEFFYRVLKSKGSLVNVHRDGANVVTILFVIGVIGRSVQLFFYHSISQEGGDVGILRANADFFFPSYFRPYLSILTFRAVTFYETPIYLNGKVPYLATVSLRKLKLLFRGFRCLRIANLNIDIMILSSAMIDIMPAILETFTLTFVVTYIFGMMGNIIFGSVISDWSTPTNGVIKAQQLTYMVDYLSSMELAMQVQHPILVAPFFLFYLIISLAVSNIALSIIIDLHATVLDDKSSKERAGQRGKLQIVFDKIVEQARSRQIFSTSSKTLQFNNVRMSQFQSSNVRQFVAGGKHAGLQLEDIKACSKLSNINLVEFYKQEHRNTKDVNWEVAFLKAVESTKLFVKKEFTQGQTIIEAGQPAKHIYLLTGGVVAVHRSGTKETAIMSPTNFFGYESLQPNTEYQVTVLCDGLSCTVMIFTQDDVAFKMDEELSGSILRMSYKSHAQLQNSFVSDTRRRSSMSMRAGSSDSIKF